MNYSLLILFLFVTCTSCKHKESDSKVQVLYDQVIEIHDEVMPKISDINKLKKKIRKSDNKGAKALTLLKELDDADESMMSWMSDFQEYKTLADSSSDVKLDYLAKEKIKISEVSDQMLSSIKNANNYIQENE